MTDRSGTEFTVTLAVGETKGKIENVSHELATGKAASFCCAVRKPCSETVFHSALHSFAKTADMPGCVIHAVSVLSCNSRAMSVCEVTNL